MSGKGGSKGGGAGNSSSQGGGASSSTQAAVDNRANQLNPNNPAYESSRAHK